MTDIESIPILEPKGRISFSSKRALFEHVKKHVLYCRDEKWAQLIDADLIARARREDVENSPSKHAILLVARQYFRMATNALGCLCRERKSHRHLYAEQARISEEGQLVATITPPDGAVQIIQAWEIEKKILIIAKAFVQNGEFTSYVICSVYRPFPKLSGESLRKNLIRKLKQRRPLQKLIEIAIHDEP